MYLLDLAVQRVLDLVITVECLQGGPLLDREDGRDGTPLLYLVETAQTFRFDVEPPIGANEWVVRMWRRHCNAVQE
ncbi:hypothetical protein [Planotetraspora mira]|uniref:hypothetical protein n=1 Tax=Planotetraspora mira TaxID=58121 RepID=UPI0019523592|nr:hypothetical protein [Planotetraspora mira]